MWASVLQHLLVAIAHINLDLGIAAAQVAPGAALGDMRRDFDRINEILAALVGAVRGNVVGVSPWVGLLDHLGGRRNDAVVNFSIVVARREAWRFASELAVIPADQRGGAIRARDLHVANLADVVLHPGPLHMGLLAVRLREGDDVRGTIERLGEVPPPSLATIDAAVQG